MGFDDKYIIVIENGAARIEAALRSCADQPVFAYAIFTCPERDGEIVTVTGWDSEPDAKIGDYEIIRVLGTDRWNGVPYPHIRSLLHDACRSFRIIPKEAAA